MAGPVSLSLLAAIGLAFVVTYLFTPKLIKYLKLIGMVGLDRQKPGHPMVAEMAGPAVLVGFLAGLFLYIWTRVFLYGTTTGLVEIFAAITTIIIITLIGIFDDLGALHKRSDMSGKRFGLKQWQKPLFTIPAAIPLMAILAGDSTMALPFIGTINIGLLYPLVLIPLGVVGAANATNMLAGMNGLEAGLGAVILGSMGLFALSVGSVSAAVVALAMAAALLALLRWNWMPAKIMPGDSLTYLVGAAIATVAIIGNIEKFAVLAFLPWFLEFFLKLRSRMRAENFGILQPDGTLKAPYSGIYSLTHAVMKIGKLKEWQIVSVIIAGELVLCTILLYFSHLV
jgi:UDP-N-acetylglucosamine--dolichyl-phosphate N-acetylglucosaminephosphotransferase